MVCVVLTLESDSLDANLQLDDLREIEGEEWGDERGELLGETIGDLAFCTLSKQYGSLKPVPKNK